VVLHVSRRIRGSRKDRSKREGLPKNMDGHGGDLIAVAVCVADLATSLARTNPSVEHVQ
jgi:hypothetical protein